MTKTDFPVGDIKFYYHIHVQRQKTMGNYPVTYPTFYRRLRGGMTLHDAIYKPRTWYPLKKKSKTPIQDLVRRTEKLKKENVQVINLPPQPPMPNNRKPKKKTLLQRFISLFK